MQIERNSGNLEKLILVGFFSTILIVTPYSVNDPINLPKMLSVGLLGFTCLGYLLQKEFIQQFRRTWVLPLLSMLFLIQSLVVLFLSGRRLSEGLYGVAGRNTGFLTYVSLLFICLAGSIVSSKKFIAKFCTLFLGVGCILLFYGFFQKAGLEPFPYVNTYANNVFGTFGNPNFQSAFIGIFGTFAFAFCFELKANSLKRAIYFLLVPMCVFGIYSTNSWQGFFNLSAGIGVVLILIFVRMNLFKLASTLLSIGILGFFTIALGLLNTGPLASLLAKASLAARRLYWEAGLNMMVKHPILGVGFDGFGDWYRRERSQIAASQNSNLVSDSAHSVPIDIGTSGGFPLLIIYLALITLTIISIIKIARNSAYLSIPFIALSGAWVSYQAQSLISINQIGLGIVGWTLSGLIIGYASSFSVNTEVQQSNSSGRATKYSIPTFSFMTFAGPIIGLIVGSLISFPPFFAANKFYTGLKSSDARLINANAYLNPLDVRRMLTTATILNQNKFYKESLEISKSATSHFPDSFEAWTLLSKLSNSSELDKLRAKSELKRLDPYLVL